MLAFYRYNYLEILLVYPYYVPAYDLNGKFHLIKMYTNDAKTSFEKKQNGEVKHFIQQWFLRD